jgi:(1->4)-alpha-D-glucan 1-alpha-D-glucosylmutase
MRVGVPLATYRLQLNARFGFDAAAAVVPYLKALGASHLYASPFLKARAGSQHGYDIVDYGALNPELGGETAFARLRDALDRADMGLILDFVPNHMAIHGADNSWWLDVLEWGPASAHAASFDIDWQAFPDRPRVLLPILGSPYGEVLERGEIELRYDAAEGSFSAWYYEHRLPIALAQYGGIVRALVAQACARETPAARRLLELVARHPNGPLRDAAAAFKQQFAAIAGADEIIGCGLSAYRAAPSSPAATFVLHALLEQQHYRIAHWRLAASELNYRRFFDINTLAGVRVEDAATFAPVHALVARLIAQGALQGLRIDHIDGLNDPQQYCDDLSRLIAANCPAPDRFYIVVEKILAEHEAVPRFTGVDGTTGYEWLNLISRVLVDETGLARLDRTWREASREDRSFADILLEAKRDVIANVLGSEFAALRRLAGRLAEAHYRTRDYAGARLQAALEAFALHVPVYRTYVNSSGASARDRAIIAAALAKARAAWIGADAGIFDFLGDALTLDLADRGDYDADDVRRFAAKMQQFTGPLMAKALEDTALYRDHRLLALNEVGGDPSAGAVSVAEFHNRMRLRAASAARGLTATATHDTKRGEDARARLLAVSDLAEEWAENVAQWRRLNSDLVDARRSERIPAAAHEYMIYQALIGAWPLDGPDPEFVDRLIAYAIKAAREGKQQTSWLAPNERYEAGLKRFIAGLLDPKPSRGFLEAFGAFARRVALIGALKSLTQVALKVAMPGAPDFYQGTELWDLAFVDPDNRRPVDFAARMRLMEAIGTRPDWPALALSWPDGRIKLALTRQLIAARHVLADTFMRGRYCPIEVVGRDSDEIISFARVNDRAAVIVACARSFARASVGGRNWPRGAAWDARLALRSFCDLRSLLAVDATFAGPEPSVSELFEALPVALLRASVGAAETKGPSGI